MYTAQNFNYTIISMKRFVIILLILILCATLSLCVKKPAMHKQISFSVINYLIEFNTDGSVTTTKQTTTTKLQKEGVK